MANLENDSWNSLEIIAATFNKILNDGGYPYDNIFPAVPLIAYLLVRDMKDPVNIGTNNRVRKEDGGKLIEIPVEYAYGTSMQMFDGLDPISFSKADLLDHALFPWKHAAQTLLMDNKDILKCKGETRKIESLTGTHLRNMNKSMATSLNTQMLSAAPVGAKDINYLDYLVNKIPATQTDVGNLDSTAKTWWRNNVTDGSSSVTTLETLVRALDHDINTLQYNAAGDKPDLLLTDQYGQENVVNYLRAKGSHTFVDEEISKVLNVEAKKFRGLTMLWDRNLLTDTVSATTRSRFYELNTDYIQFVVDEERQFRLEGPQKMVFSSGQDATAWAIFLMCQFCISNRAKQGLLWGVPQTGMAVS